MDTVVFVLQILMWILCPAVIGLILLQGAAGDISSAFGGGGQLDASLGVGAHRKMAQATGVLAFLFFAMVLALAYPHRKSFHDVNGSAKPAAVTQPAPAIPAKPPIMIPTGGTNKPVEATPAPVVPAAPLVQSVPTVEAIKPVETTPAVVTPAPAAVTTPAAVEAPAQPPAPTPPAKP